MYFHPLRQKKHYNPYSKTLTLELTHSLTLTPTRRKKNMVETDQKNSDIGSAQKRAFLFDDGECVTDQPRKKTTDKTVT